MEWVTVYTTNQLFEAEIIQGVLMSEDLEVCILNKKDSCYTTFGFVEIKVPAHDLVRASQILQQHQIIK